MRPVPPRPRFEQMEAVVLRPQSGRRILMFSLLGVGDIVHDQALFALLRRRNPDAVVDVVAPVAAVPLFRRMPEVGRLWPRPARGDAALSQRARLVRAIRGQYAQSIVVGKSAKAALVPFLAGIPQRTGFANAELPLLFNDVRAPAASCRKGPKSSSSSQRCPLPWI